MVSSSHLPSSSRVPLASALLSLWAALDAVASEPLCSYRSLHAHELAVHTRRPFRIDCSAAVANATASVDWGLPSDCALTDAAAQPAEPSTIDVACSTPGLKAFRAGTAPSSGGEVLQTQVSVSRTNLCHDWFIAQEEGGGAAAAAASGLRGERVVLRAWLYSFPSASVEEQTGTACHPSTASQHLTREFQHLGERPRLKASAGQSFSDVSVSWDQERTCWRISLTVDAAIHRHRVQLVGQHIGVLDCHTRPRAAVLSVASHAGAGSASSTTMLTAVEGATDWRAVGCRATGQQPPAVTSLAAAATSGLDAYTGGELLLHAPRTSSTGYDWCGSCGVAAMLLLQSSTGSVTAAGILLARAAGETARVLTLPPAIRSAAVNDASDGGCDVVLTRHRQWALPVSELDDGAAVLIVACGQKVYSWANDSWTSVAPWTQSETAPRWTAHVQTLSSCVSFAAWSKAAPVVLWTDEWVAEDSVSELPLYFASGSTAGWQHVPELLTFAVACFSDAGDANAEQWSVQSSTVLEGVPHVIVLLQRSDSNSTRNLFIYDQADRSWTQGAAIEVNTGSNGQSCEMGMVGTGTGTSELYVWDSHLWYSPDGGLYMHEVSLLQADGRPPAQQQCIRTLVTSEDGQVAAVTANQTVYWGYIGFPHLVEVSVLEDDARTIVSFDMLGQLIARRLSQLSEDVTALAADASGGLTQTRVHFQSRPIPHNPAVSDTTGLHACPYQHLTSDLPPVIYLDKGESISATVTVDGAATGGGAAQAPQLAVSSSDFGGQKVHLRIKESFAAVGLASIGATYVTVSAPKDSRSHESEGGFAFATVTVRVSTSSLHCPADVVSPMGVNVGCPPGRTIRVIHDATECDQQQEPSEADRASAEEWRDHSSPYIDHTAAAGGASTSATGSSSCTQQMYHGTAPWRPRVVLYDFETALEDVTVDYIVFERTGRTDYMFNATEAQAGCAAIAQTAATLYSGEAFYTPCFDPAGGMPTAATDDSASQLYEIMNASGVNALKFTTPGGNGRFTFGLRVVDPTFSHCALETTFLVDVYGAPIDGGTSLVIALTTVGVITCSLFASFVCFRRQSEGCRVGVM